jgi:hypothetical protein
MRNLLNAASALALASTLGACATITRGTTTQFTVESSPPAAQVKTSTGFNCEATPCTFKMPRKEKFVVTVSKAGYKTATLQIGTKLAGAGAAGFVGNAVLGGVIGAGVDVASGATLDLSPNPAYVSLEPDAPAPTVASAPSPAPANAPAVAASQPPSPAASTAAAAAPAAQPVASTKQ